MTNERGHGRRKHHGACYGRLYTAIDNCLNNLNLPNCPVSEGVKPTDAKPDLYS
jgi:hypothetical protein